MNFSFSLLMAFFLDLLLGDPRWVPHPVKFMGRLIAFLERKMNRPNGERILRIKGALMALFVISCSFLCTFLILYAAEKVSEFIKILFYILLSYLTLSTRDLYDHGMAIYKRLNKNDIEGAKCALSKIVGRDVEHMDGEQIVKSAIESIAENTNDGALAPLFYLILGGPLLAMVYKAVNTLDSMVGYKNERYFYFGFFSAKLDDFFGFIPARISAFLIALSSLLYYRSFSVFLSSLKTFMTQGSHHPSPNSGYPEAAMAGALRVKISGPQYYGGRLSFKPYIGEDRREVKPELLKEALHIMIISSFLMLTGGILLHGI